jgi:hypothetical protein
MGTRDIPVEASIPWHGHSVAAIVVSCGTAVGMSIRATTQVNEIRAAPRLDRERIPRGGKTRQDRKRPHGVTLASWGT